jgi:hypothetical protein
VVELQFAKVRQRLQVLHVLNFVEGQVERAQFWDLSRYAVSREAAQPEASYLGKRRNFDDAAIVRVQGVFARVVVLHEHTLTEPRQPESTQPRALTHAFASSLGNSAILILETDVSGKPSQGRAR